MAYDSDLGSDGRIQDDIGGWTENYETLYVFALSPLNFIMIYRFICFPRFFLQSEFWTQAQVKNFARTLLFPNRKLCNLLIRRGWKNNGKCTIVRCPGQSCGQGARWEGCCQEGVSFRTKFERKRMASAVSSAENSCAASHSCDGCANLNDPICGFGRVLQVFFKFTVGRL